MVKAELVNHIEGLGDVYVANAQFDEELKALKRVGVKSPYAINVRDVAYQRLNGGSLDGTRTCHAPVCAKDSPTILMRVSPLVKNFALARIAVNSHRNNKYPVLDNDKHIYATAEKIANANKGEKPENRRAIILPYRGDYDINADADESNFLFQGLEKEYFNRFRNGKNITISQISTNAIDSTDGTIVNYLWFYRPDYDSGLVLRNRYLNLDGRAFGVRCEAAKQRATKNSEGQKIEFYTPTQIRKALRTSGLKGIEDMLFKNLRR